MDKQDKVKRNVRANLSSLTHFLWNLC